MELIAPYQTIKCSHVSSIKQTKSIKGSKVSSGYKNCGSFVEKGCSLCFYEQARVEFFCESHMKDHIDSFHHNKKQVEYFVLDGYQYFVTRIETDGVVKSFFLEDNEMNKVEVRTINGVVDEVVSYEV